MSFDTDKFIERSRTGGAVPASSFGSPDESYWESLLQDGEVVSHETPPPWLDDSPDHSSEHPGNNSLSDEEKDWQKAIECQKAGACVNLIASGFNRGGVLVQFGQLTGFVPSSHLIGFPAYPNPREREEALLNRIGEEFRLRVIEIDRQRNRLILSERTALESEHCEQLFASLEPGSTVAGTVSNLRRFGAFVDLGGYEGLIHISEMSWGRVTRPGDVVQPGDKIQVYVMDIDPDQRKIQLSLKRLQTDPWQAVVEQYENGDLVRGQVTNVVSFGAFVRLSEGVEGLVHISELAEGNFLHPRNVVQEGQWVEARVLNVDPKKRRIGLSLRQVHQNNHQPVAA